MKKRSAIRKLTFLLCFICWLSVFTQGCSTEGVIGGTLGFTTVTGMTPSHNLEQVYYLGVFDPQDQIPPTIYRVTVRGQASAISQMNFGSGWVPAHLIDSLNSNISINKKTGLTEITHGGTEQMAAIQAGRRLVQFGPEGFREAPANHRLVIVMGSSPEAYFSAIDEALGSVSQAQEDQRNSNLNKLLFEALLKTTNEKESLLDLKTDLEVKQ